MVPAALVELDLAEHTMATSLWVRLDLELLDSDFSSVGHLAYLTTLTISSGNLPTLVPVSQ